MQRSEHLEVLCDRGPFPPRGSLDCAAVTVGGRYTRDAARVYADTSIRAQTLVDWPSGLGKPTVRQIEAVAAAKDGTAAVQVMAHPAHVMDGYDAALREDVMGLVIAVREVSRDIGVDVVVDADWLPEEDAAVAALGLAIRESGGDGVVVSATKAANEQARRAVSALSAAAGPMRVKVVAASAAEEVFCDWLSCGADRVVVPSGILFG